MMKDSAEKEIGNIRRLISIIEWDLSVIQNETLKTQKRLELSHLKDQLQKLMKASSGGK